MTPLKQVRIGWKGLENIINEIIDKVNISVPIEGDGIRIVDAPNGKVISASSQPASNSASGATTQVASQAHSTIDKISWYGVKWQDVTVVDPSTCAQSTLTVLVNTGDESDSILIGLAIPLWGDPV